jgi:glycosidase
MNYPLRSLILVWTQGKTKANQVEQGLKQLLAAYPFENWLAMYNLLGSHDVERYLTLLKGDTQRAKLGYTFLFSLPGAPSIYYGDEIGLLGGKDPDCRRAFPWDANSWDKDLRGFFQHMISLRKSLEPLRAGTVQLLHDDSSHNTLAFSRSTGDERVVVVLNGSEEEQVISLPLSTLGMHPGQEATECLSGSRLKATEETLRIHLPAFQAGWIRPE